MQAFPPQVLGLEVDLVASETGLVIWTSSVQLDASDARVRESLERYTETLNQSSGTNESLQLTLISPARFARFAAHEVAQVL